MSHFKDRGLSFPIPSFIFLGMLLLSPRPGRTIVDGIPGRDDRWSEKFFVFKVNQASVGDLDFNRIRQEWSDDVGKLFLAFTNFFVIRSEFDRLEFL